jgi:hypothetical protein
MFRSRSFNNQGNFTMFRKRLQLAFSAVLITSAFVAELGVAYALPSVPHNNPFEMQVNEFARSIYAAPKIRRNYELASSAGRKSLPQSLRQMPPLLSGLLLRNALVDVALVPWRSDDRSQLWQFTCAVVLVTLSVVQPTHRFMAW